MLPNAMCPAPQCIPVLPPTSVKWGYYTDDITLIRRLISASGHSVDFARISVRAMGSEPAENSRPRHHRKFWGVVWLVRCAVPEAVIDKVKPCLTPKN